MSDGNIEFLGRIDHQVKIRGFRIETGEIEQRLLAFAGIREAVVICREEEKDNKYLCSYIVPVPGRQIAVGELRKFLLTYLPEYMVPGYFVMLEQIPLTPNGKIDRKALPAPVVTIGPDHVAAHSGLEKQLRQIWSGILGVEEDVIGVDSNFFELGGHSLKATMLGARIQKMFRIKLPLAQVFKTPHIRGLAAYIATLKKDKEYASIEPVEWRDYYPCSSAQKRLYIEQQMKMDNTAYNMPVFVLLQGRLERRRLDDVFNRLIQRHETFRTAFEIVNHEVVQRVGDGAEFHIEHHHIEQHQVEPRRADDIVNGFVRPFELSRAPLLRVGLIETERFEHILMLDMHHIIVDGISLGIVMGEFMALYRGDSLPDVRIHYKDFSLWQSQWIRSGGFKTAENYWLNRFAGDIPVLDFPTDYPRDDAGQPAREIKGGRVVYTLDHGLSGQCNALVKEKNTTLSIFFTAVFTVLLFKYTGQEDIVVGNGIAGRNHADLEHVPGFFINMLAMRNFPGKELTFGDFLKQVAANALDAYKHQDYPFEELVKKLGLQGEAGRNPLFDFVIQMQNFEMAEMNIPGLTLKPYGAQTPVSHFDLVIYAGEINGTISLDLAYSTRLFRESTIGALAESLRSIVEQVTDNREIQLKDIRVEWEFDDATTDIAAEDIQFGF